MPELPEVEVVRRGLEKHISEQPQILRFEFLRKDLRNPIPIKKLKTLEGSKIHSIERRAKYLLFHTEKGIILSHLGMTGTWRIAPKGGELNHDHIYIHLSNGERWAFRDPRRFGMFEFIELKNLNLRFSELGVEPLSKEFSGEVLWQTLRGKKTSIKVAIMDQRNVVGVGNIYASEALFRAKIKPARPAFRVSKEECDRLAKAIKTVLKKSIEAGGSTISDFKKSDGDSGYFQTLFQVYDREGEPCVICATPLKVQVLGGRSTYWCNRCQPK